MLSKLVPHRNGHTWKFFRAGGLDQVRLETGADIVNLEKLDQKLWVALACPVKGLEADEKTLTLIDTDKDGRIRVPEVLAAIAFCRDHLKNLDGLIRGADSIPLADFNEASAAGKSAVACAKEVLKSHGRAEAAGISLADVSDTAAIFAKALFNGDGVLTAEATEDPALKQVFADILATVGGTNDRGGSCGVAQANMDAFFGELAVLEAWYKKAEEVPAEVLPLGADTNAAALAVTAVQAKIDDFFARCRLAAFDPRALAAVNRNEDEYLALAAKDLTISVEEIKGFPLARIEAGRALPLVAGVNPAWADALASLNAAAVTPIFGAKQDTLTEAQWAQIKAKLAAHMVWAAAKPATKVDSLGLDRIRAILASDAKAGLDALIAQDKACEAEFNKIAELEKLIRLHRDLFRLLHNFTAFTDFYSPDRWSSFQAGTLYLDNRSCDLVLRVEDAAKHASMAHLSKCYLAYCDCTRPNGEKMSVVAVFSGGDSDYLMAGRNGVFYDRKGRDWDATITKVVDNPISIRQAFFSPYKKFAKMIDDMIAKRAAAADAEANAKMASSAEAPKAAEPKKFDMGMLVMVSLVLGTVSSIIMSFLNLGMWIPPALIGIMLAISGPSMLMAALKLRQRTMGPVLDANGWAINGRVKVNIPFGGSLTKLPEFPAGSERSLKDPYEQKRSPWTYAAWATMGAVALVLTGILAYHIGFLPEPVRSRMAIIGVPQYLVNAKQKQADLLAAAREELAPVQAEFDAADKKFKDAQPVKTLAANGMLVETKPLNQVDSDGAEADRKRLLPILTKAKEKVKTVQDAYVAASDKVAAAEKAKAEALAR